MHEASLAILIRVQPNKCEQGILDAQGARQEQRESVHGGTRSDQALLITTGAWRLIKATTHILMEGAPAGIDLAEVRSAMTEAAGVERVHDLHIWTLTSGVEALSAHVLLRPDCSARDRSAVLASLKRILHTRFIIEHTTIQIEDGRQENLGVRGW